MNSRDTVRKEIHHALDAVSGTTPDLMPGIARRLGPPARRRPYLAIAQSLAVIGLAVVIGIVVLSTRQPRVTPSPVTTPTAPIIAGPGANIAWVLSQSRTAGGDVFTGIDQTGHIVGRITAPVDLRSPDGAHLYALETNDVAIFSALDGHKEATIRLQAATGPGIQMLSADGRYLAVVGGSPSVVELVDLTARRSLASTELGTPAYGAPLILGSHAEHIYVVGDTAARLGFNGSTLRVEQRTTNQLACQSLVVGGINSSGGLPFRVLADGRTVVAFCPADGHITWFDLVDLKVTHEVTNGQANPFWVCPVFSADGKTLYLHEGGTGALAAVDLSRQKIDKTAKVALADPNPLAWLGSMFVTTAYAGAIPRTAAVSPDGNWMYAVGGFDRPYGVSVVHLPDLTVKGRWLPDVAFETVWVSADGRTIYLLSRDDHMVRLLRTDGTQFGTVTLPGNADSFVVPSVP